MCIHKNVLIIKHKDNVVFSEINAKQTLEPITENCIERTIDGTGVPSATPPKYKITIEVPPDKFIELTHQEKLKLYSINTFSMVPKETVIILDRLFIPESVIAVKDGKKINCEINENKIKTDIIADFIQYTPIFEVYYKNCKQTAKKFTMIFEEC